jgi:IS605 OrfB family transposase
VYLVGKRGRDARFLEDGRVSVSTIKGRKKIGYREATGHVGFIERAKLVNSINILERDGRLEGRVCVTLEVDEPEPVHPVGVDLNETNAIVAMRADGGVFFLSGREDRESAKRTRKTRVRLQRKLASRKAQGKDTRSVRRALKRLGRKQRNRNRTSCQMMAAELSKWAGEDAVLVLEDLELERKKKGNGMSKALRRRLNGWPHGLMQQCISHRAEVSRQAVVKVNPAYTSQQCNRCGQLGQRRRHLFSCSCGYQAHADVNASANLRDRYTALRRSGALSVALEALL